MSAAASKVMLPSAAISKWPTAPPPSVVVRVVAPAAPIVVKLVNEETELVIKILSLAGITIKDQGLYQIAAGEDVKNIQQEKQ